MSYVADQIEYERERPSPGGDPFSETETEAALAALRKEQIMTEVKIGETTSNGWTKVAEFEVEGDPEFVAVFTGPPAERTGLPVLSVEMDGEEIFRAWTAEDYTRVARSLRQLADAIAESAEVVEETLKDLVRDRRRNGQI